MNKFFKELYNIINNNTDLLFINNEFILNINNSLIKHKVSNKSAVYNFINLYKKLLLVNDENLELLRKKLYNLTNNKNLKQYIKTLDITKFITELTRTELFIEIFNKYFLILTNANDIIDNVCYNQNWLQLVLSNLLNKLVPFIITRAAKNNLSADEQISSLINSDELINFCSFELQEYYNMKEFFIYIVNKEKINNNYYPLLLRGKLSNTEFVKLAQYLYDKYNEILINYLIDNIDFLQGDINAHQASELDKIDMSTGESIPINGELFHELTHSDKYIPIIYINGNVVVGEAVNDSDNGRIHHSSLFKAYCKDMSLHKFDKIKKSEYEWKDLIKGISIYSHEISILMEKYKCVRAVQSVTGTAVAIIVAYNNVSEAANAFKNQLSNCDKVFACNDSWTELTKEAKLKRLMKKV